MGRSRKKKIIEGLVITGMADKGKAVGRTPEGQVVFVDGLVPGDVARVLITKKRKGFLQGRSIGLEQPSEKRIPAFCSHFGKCGGCKWQNLEYDTQLTYKNQIVQDAIKRIGKIEPGQWLPILGSTETQFYRNKLEFSFSSKKWLTPEELNTDMSNKENVLGFHPPGAFDKIIHVDKCYLQYEPSNKIRQTIFEICKEQDYEFWDARANVGFPRNIVIRTSTTGQIMVVMVVGENDMDKTNRLMEAIKERLPEITSLHYCINTKVNDFILDLDIVNFNGLPYIEEMLGAVKFRIGPKSFFQTNTRQAVRLFDKVVEFADLKGSENVYDLYTGIGSIALYVSNYCKQVVAVEEVPEAIEDAKVNAEINEIDNCIFYAGDVKDIVDESFATKHGKPDLVITDPPRAGMHAKLIETLLDLEAPVIVYVSCNPATQARDLQLLSEKYQVEKIQPVDMFPHTHHIEVVARLSLRS